MSYSDTLRSLPIFHGLSDEQLERFCAAFDEVDCEAGWVLFEAGAAPDHLDLLVEGSVAVTDAGRERFTLRPPAIIGELGVLTGLDRHTTTKATESSRILRIARKKLLAFLEAQPDIAFRFHQNLLEVVSDKVERDERRLDEMRRNIISTQKSMKRLRDLVLSSQVTPISETIHDTLEVHIAQNRRVNYTIAPPKALPAEVRLPDGRRVPVLALSRTRIRLPLGAAGDDEAWKGVLVLPDTELPLDGSPLGQDEEAVDVELSLMIDEYVAQLEDYLTRAQILDVVV